MRRFLLSFAFLGIATAASAQQVGPGWSAFTGCWTPVGADGERNVAANTPRVCVVPTGSNSAELVTLMKDSVTGRTPIDASGSRRDVSKQGCSGWEKAEFSADGRRLFLTGEQTCAGGLKRKTSGIFAIASNGDWINAVDVSADSVSSVRVTRYAAASVAPALASDVRDALQSREASDRTARISAQREVTVNAVIEASRFLSPAAEEAWLAELEQDFNLDEKTLVRLAEEGVPPSVIDVLVAVSNPRVFSVRPTGSVSRNDESDSAKVRRQYAPCFAPTVDPWAWYAYDPCDPYLRYSYYRPYSRYGRYGYPYDRYGYGYGYYDPYYYYSPVIIVSASADKGHGRMTKDGYKRDGSTGSSSGSSSSTGSTASKGSGDSGRSSSGSGSSSSGSNGGRTATRKPPSDDAPRTSASTSTSSTSTSSTPTTSSTSSSGDASSGSGRVATRKPPTG